jgi:hypothetical protein
MTATDIRQQVLDFAAQFPTPNVKAAVAYAEAGTITWEAVHGLFHISLAKGLAEVGA